MEADRFVDQTWTLRRVPPARSGYNLAATG